MINNPEFKRNIWLELSVQRLIAVPVLLGLIFYVAMQNDSSGAISYTIAKSIFVIVTILWGSQLAFSSVSDELQNRTWDNQRLSALSPFKLVWGKLFGATAFVWYIGLLCLVMMLFTAQLNIQSNQYQIIIGLILGALITQAFAFASALIAAKNNVAIPRGLNLLFIVVLVPIIGRMIYGSNQPTQAWYGQDLSYWGFVNVSLLIYTAWAWLASYRIMQTALQIKTKPWAMLSFVLFSAFYVLGFYNALSIGNFASLAFVFAILMTYLGALTEKRDLASLRRCMNPWLAKTPEKALKHTPYFLILAVFCLIALPFTSLDSTFSSFYSAKSLREGQSFVVIGLMSLLLMMRDIGLLYYFSLSQKPQRAVMTTIFYLILLYVLLPLLLPRTLGFIFFPLVLAPSVGENGVPILVGLAHCLAVAWLLYRQHLARHKALSA